MLFFQVVPKQVAKGHHLEVLQMPEPMVFKFYEMDPWSFSPMFS